MIFSPVFSPDGRRLAAAISAEGIAVILDSASVVTVGEPLRHRSQVNHATFSPDGRLVATGSVDTTARLWDAATHRPVGPPLLHRNRAEHVEFNADGSRLLTQSPDAVRVWDTKTGAPITDPLPGGNDPVTASAFSADGSRAASATAGGEVRVWGAGSGQLLVEPIRVTGAVAIGSLKFDASGRFLIFATDAGDFYAWPLPPSSIGHPVPGWLLKLATAVAGGTVDAKAVLREQAGDAQAFDEVRRELATLPADAPYAEWGRWFFADRATRPIAPGFTLTPAEAEKLAASMAPPPAATAPKP